jgi:hypothetical protein
MVLVKVSTDYSPEGRHSSAPKEVFDDGKVSVVPAVNEHSLAAELRRPTGDDDAVSIAQGKHVNF